jgi:hypothetical protein
MSSVLIWTSETPPPAPRPYVEQTYVQCRTCWYDKVLGQPCGLPCL